MSGTGEAIRQVTEGGPAEHYMQAFRHFRQELPGSGIPWVQRLRDTAMSRFANEGFPTTRREAWKYTSVAPIEKRVFLPTYPGGHGLGVKDIERFLLPGLDAHLLVFVDGQFAADVSRLEALPDGATVEPFAHALPAHVDDIELHLGRYADMAGDPFVALNTAFMGDGVYLHLAPGVRIERPIHLLYVGTDGEAMSSVRNLVVADESSEATVIEHYAGIAEVEYFTNAVTELALAGNAGIEHYKIEEESRKAFHVATIQAYQGRDSRLTQHNVCLNGRLVRNDVNSLLDDEGIECAFNGLYLLRGRQHADNHTLIEHAKPRSTSRELYKGVLDGHARGVFNGRIVIRKYAQQSDSQQTSRALLLSRNAEVDPKPQLEIFADDVKAAHGSTVGQIDKDALYYLRSRGVPEAEARGLLTYAFANEVITHMRLEAVRTYLEGIILSRLPKGAEIKETL